MIQTAIFVVTFVVGFITLAAQYLYGDIGGMVGALAASAAAALLVPRMMNIVTITKEDIEKATKATAGERRSAMLQMITKCGQEGRRPTKAETMTAADEDITYLQEAARKQPDNIMLQSALQQAIRVRDELRNTPEEKF